MWRIAGAGPRFEWLVLLSFGREFLWLLLLPNLGWAGRSWLSPFAPGGRGLAARVVIQA